MSSFRFNLVIERLLISGAASESHDSRCQRFQSRYRAASHFRIVTGFSKGRWYAGVSISLSSGFSFQGHLLLKPVRRYQRFNLVIERLLISGNSVVTQSPMSSFQFQSRYRAASHFRFKCNHFVPFRIHVSISLSSGFSFQVARHRIVMPIPYSVSISLSSGFSFQEWQTPNLKSTTTTVSISLSSGFSFQVQLLSEIAKRAPLSVSISLSSGFSFQVVDNYQWTLQSPSMFQSRYRAASHFRAVVVRVSPRQPLVVVSISLSSGFSFQVENCSFLGSPVGVSISLSSGFSFQVNVTL